MSKNPIKHVNFSKTDYYQPRPNIGGGCKLHKELTQDFINDILESISSLQEDLIVQKTKTKIHYMAAVVELENKAISKSNRPLAIFNDTTCPFFGDVGFSKFLIKTTPEGLNKLKHKIKNSSGKKTLESALSTIKKISKLEPKLQLKEKNNSYVIRLIRFENELINNEIDFEFELLLNSSNLKWKKYNSEKIRIYKVMLENEQIQDICNNNVFVQSVSPSNTLKSCTTYFEENNKPVAMSYPDHDYPTVGLIDTAISQFCEPLEPWVTGRVSIIPNEEKDIEHGTFVAGLLTNASLLNDSNPLFPLCQSKVYSIEAIGQNGGDFYDILNTLDSEAKKNPNIKVWNLSLSEDTPVKLGNISEFGILLDEFQDKHKCLCVVSAGNYEKIRTWPPEIGHNDGISSPGDSVRALTVGSVAHCDGLVKSGEPSCFSRKGPVSNFVQKPEVVHYGGNLELNGNCSHKTSIKSVCPNGYSTYDVGTSFSTPLISTIAANLFHKLGDRATPCLVKGLLIHSANLRSTNIKNYREYYGWGIPADIDTILNVNDYETTIVFEGVAEKSFEVEKLPFPIPDCLRTPDGKVKGEFFITLVYQPELDPKKSFEYCQIDVSVGLGKTDGVNCSSKVPLQTSKSKYEEELTKTGDKWSPIKVYHKAYPKGTDVDNWKLRIYVLNRDGYEAVGVKIPFSIILTIRDIDKQQPVYNQMARLMEQYNWEVSDLIIDHRLQL